MEEGVELSLSGQEPTSADEVRAWVAQQRAATEVFPTVARASDEHQAEHGCDVFESSNATLLAVLARAARAEEILEVGCGVGYSALWLAYGSAPAGKVTTIEKDPVHAEIARGHFAQEGYSHRISLLEGAEQDVLAALEGRFDLVFYDSTIPGPTELDRFADLVVPNGILVTSNIFLGQFDPGLEGLERGARYRRCLLADDRWLTTFTGDWAAVSVRL